MSYNSYWYPPKMPPKQVKGGIKAQSKRGSFATNWWSKLWVENFEVKTDSGRLTRARSYARSGQTKDLEIAVGLVKASVQGTAGKPYQIKVAITPYSKEKIEEIYQGLSSQPMLVAQMLNNNLPEEFDKLLKDLGLFLIPRYNKDMDVSCDCLDWGDPCKHSAAILYLITEEIDKNPFLLLKMLGIEKDKLLERLKPTGIKEKPARHTPIAEEPLSADPDIFWGKTWERRMDPIAPPQIPAAIIKRLGTLPFWRSDSDFMKLMEDSYAKASAELMSLLMRE
ncbi:MAG: SWIM zinc finger family protein [Candidatus Cloacimonetes bacterium]|nr:SWIM zinc finger family protein [Candidatus Cloacimonadota bacterium]